MCPSLVQYVKSKHVFDRVTGQSAEVVALLVMQGGDTLPIL